jgi:hypothetical protein
MVEFFTYIGCLTLACLGVFQISLILGAPIGKFAWGGAHTILPTKLRYASVTSLFLYLFFALILLSKANIIGIIGNKQFVDISIWVMTVYFFVGIIMNAASRSKSERFAMTPTASILAVAFLIVAMS